MSIFKRKLSQASDEELMAGIQAANLDAFDELYRRYHRRIFYYFLRMLGGDREKAEDFLQDVFLKIIDKPQLFNPKRKFSAWIFTVAHNACKNEYRRLNHREIMTSGDALDAIFPQNPEHREADADLDLKQFSIALSRELAKMDAEHRSTFLLRFQEHFSLQEISRMMNCPEGTVKSRLYYSLKKLADRLAEFNPNFIEADEHERA